MGETNKRGRKPKNFNTEQPDKVIQQKVEKSIELNSIENKKDKITAYMATFPSREEGLIQAVESLIGQVDELVIVTNGYVEIPKYTNVKVVNTLEMFGDIGCAGKFVYAFDWNGYVLTVDDDFIYPKDYVSKTIEAIEKYNRKAVISWHGRTCDFPVKRYKGGHKKFYQCTKKVDSDNEVNILGTGVMGFHSDTILPKYDIMEIRHTNCSDIYFSMSMDMREIPMIVPKHEENWIVPIININCICTQNHEEFLVPLINSYNWKKL